VYSCETAAAGPFQHRDIERFHRLELLELVRVACGNMTNVIGSNHLFNWGQVARGPDLDMTAKNSLVVLYRHMRQALVK